MTTPLTDNQTWDAATLEMPVDGVDDCTAAGIQPIFQALLDRTGYLLKTLLGGDPNGKVPQGVLPSIVLTDTYVVGSQAAMLALAAHMGDVCVRTDVSECFILTTADPTQLANWQQLLTPASPVQSVFGRTGVVTMLEADVTAALGFTPEDASKKGTPSGYAPLGADSLVPGTNLPPHPGGIRNYIQQGGAGSYAYVQQATSANLISGGNNANTTDFSLANAVDGNLATAWASSQSGAAVNGAAYIGIDAGAGKAVEIRRVSWNNYTDNNSNVSSALGEYSDDGAAWTSAQTIASSTLMNAFNSSDIPASGNHRYWRLLANSGVTAPAAWAMTEVAFLTLEETGSPALAISATAGAVDLVASPESPFCAVFATGFDGSSPVNTAGPVLTAGVNAWWAGLAAGATSYLYMGLAGGAYSLGTDTLAPIESTEAPSAPAAGQVWINPVTGLVQQWGSSWTPIERVYVGEAVVDASGTVTSVRSYAPMGVYASGRVACNASTAYTVDHNLGSEAAEIEVMAATVAGGALIPVTITSRGRNSVSFTTPGGAVQYVVNARRL